MIMSCSQRPRPVHFLIEELGLPVPRFRSGPYGDQHVGG